MQPQGCSTRFPKMILMEELSFVKEKVRQKDEGEPCRV